MRLPRRPIRDDVRRLAGVLSTCDFEAASDVHRVFRPLAAGSFSRCRRSVTACPLHCDTGPGCRMSVRAPGARSSEIKDLLGVYVGFDVSADGLNRAETGAHDEVLVGGIRSKRSSPEGRPDAPAPASSARHVASMCAVTQYAALVPKGWRSCWASGRVRAFASRVIPYRASARSQPPLLGSYSDDKFRRCLTDAPTALLKSCVERWLDIVGSSVPAQSENLSGLLAAFAARVRCYETWAKSPRVNLVTHCMVDAVA